MYLKLNIWQEFCILLFLCLSETVNNSRDKAARRHCLKCLLMYKYIQHSQFSSLSNDTELWTISTSVKMALVLICTGPIGLFQVAVVSRQVIQEPSSSAYLHSKWCYCRASKGWTIQAIAFQKGFCTNESVCF